MEHLETVVGTTTHKIVISAEELYLISQAVHEAKDRTSCRTQYTSLHILLNELLGVK